MINIHSPGSNRNEHLKEGEPSVLVSQDAAKLVLLELKSREGGHLVFICFIYMYFLISWSSFMSSPCQKKRLPLIYTPIYSVFYYLSKHSHPVYK